MTRKTHYLFKSYAADANIYGDNANAIIFINEGTNTCIINGTINLAANASISLNGNIGDKDNTNYYITFIGAGTNILRVIFKYDTHAD